MVAQKERTPTTEEILWHWCREGWKYRGLGSLSAKQRKEYGERVKYEVELIISKDFSDYFLMLSDVVRTVKDRGIAVGPARGSAAASLVCYLLRITEVDPMKFPLMIFERFIDPNRFDLPDVDLDFEDDRRDEVRQIMIEKYGEDRVGNIGTFTRYRGKNAIDDVARVYQIPRFEVERAKEFLVERSGGDTRFDASIADTVEMFPQVKEVFDKHPDLYKSLELEGNYKSFGVHAAGIVVGAEPLWKYVATYGKNNVGRNKASVQVLSVDKYDGEHLGLLKVDALGLTTMGMLSRVIKMVGMSLEDLYALPLDDAATLEAFSKADVVGIFQFEGRTARMVTQEMVPKTFMDLVAINALARPGPLHSGTTGDYIAVRHGRAKRVDIHPQVAEICATTEGQIIYQEQILQITREIGNFPWTHAAAIRKIISNRQGESAFNAMFDEFLKGTRENGIEDDVSREIWRRIATAGAYAFNIAHCVSYSILAYWSMWFKVNHPLEFYAAQLSKTSDQDKLLHLMRDMQDKRFGRDYQVLPPDPVESGVNWTPGKHGVLAGFAQIPGVGENKAAEILAARDAGQIHEWQDLISVRGFGLKTLEKILAFVEDPDPFGINAIKDATRSILEFIKEGGMPGVPMPNTNADEIPYDAKESRHVVLGLIKNRNLQDYFENHRSRTGEELDPSKVKRPELKDSVTLYVEDATGTMTMKVGRFDYPRLKADLWEAKVGHDYILAVCKKYPFLGKTIHIERLWIIDPD